jgi:hypothetical protein
MRAQYWHEYERLAGRSFPSAQGRPDAMAEYAAIERISKSAAT